MITIFWIIITKKEGYWRDDWFEATFETGLIIFLDLIWLSVIIGVVKLIIS